MSESSRVADPDSAVQPPRKRGRKRIEEPPAGMSAAEELLDAEKKRKLQNRAAQRAFRERKEKHVADLEERVRQQEERLAECIQVIRSLAAETEALRRGERPPPTHIPSAISDYEAGLAQQGNKGSSIASTSSPPEVKPRVDAPVAEVQKIATAPGVPAFSTAYSPVMPVRAPSPPPQMPRTPSSLDILATASQSPASMKRAQEQSSAHVYSFDEAKFDFDAPFDFSETMPLPPLFSSLAQEYELLGGGGLDHGSGTGTPNTLPGADGPGTDAYEDLDDACPNDEDEPPLLPGNRIPCDKPECDFTAVSCALPVPWRPPTVAGDDKNLWVAQKCWAKLCSHPLFPLCDSDELCQLLRDKTRCSDDGRLVCHRSDVCDIFRSLPKLAKLRQQTLSMA